MSVSLTNRMQHQQHRIQQGVQSGELKPRETARLERAEVRVDAKIARDAFDGGGMTKKEKAVDTALQNGLSARIFVQKHDGQSSQS